MVVEHVFVTVLESADALKRASDYLSARGFAVAPDSAGGFTVGGENPAWTTLEMQRGKTSSGRAKNIAQLPQKIRIEWDRGRMTVALSIAASAAWGGSSFMLTNQTPGNLKKMQLHIRLLNAIAIGLEHLLAYNGTGQPEYADWDATEKEILAVARRRKIRTIIILLLVFLMLGAVITIAVMNA